MAQDTSRRDDNTALFEVWDTSDQWQQTQQKTAKNMQLYGESDSTFALNVS